MTISSPQLNRSAAYVLKYLTVRQSIIETKTSPSADESTPLIYRTIYVNAPNRPKDSHTVSRGWLWACLALAVTCILAVAALFTQTARANELQSRMNVLKHCLKKYPPTRAELDELKRDWEDAKAAHEEESKTWSEARAGFEADKERWAKARNDHYSVRVHEGNRLGLSWTGVQGHQCVAYGTRAYSAHLVVNKEEACQYMPLTLGGEFVDQPHQCYSVSATAWKRTIGGLNGYVGIRYL